MKSNNQKRGQSVVKESNNKGVRITFAGAKNKMDGISNFLGNISEA
jgi:hypothetical protein